MRASPLSMLVRPTPPSPWLGTAVALLFIVVESLLTYPLHEFTKESTPSVIYLLGVVLVSIVWGLWLGVATALVSVVAFVSFYVRPISNLTDSDVRDVTPLVVFVTVAVVVSALANQSRRRAEQAQESDLTADMARLLLDTDDVTAALPTVSRKITQALNLPTAVIEPAPRSPGAEDPDPDRMLPDESAAGEIVLEDGRITAFPLHHDGTLLGTLRVPAGVSDRQVDRLRQRVVPPLVSLLHAARERGAMVNTLAARGEELQQRAAQQAALQRVATLVARAVSPADVFHAVTTEVSRLLDNRHTTLLHYEPDGTVTIISTNQPGLMALPGNRWRTTARANGHVGNSSVTDLVRRTGRAARTDSYADDTVPGNACRRTLGIQAAVAVPIVVENRLWGTLAVTSAQAEPLPQDAEARITDFTDLAATAIANADSRAQLIASRARIATAADEARQRIERDLHDGAQQHLIAISLELRAAEDIDMPPEQLRAHMAHAATSLTAVVTDLRELARGIHPAILGAGGLAPALKALARRSAIPVELHIHTDHRPPTPVEVAAYYVVSESLTNAAKHSQASVVDVSVTTQSDMLQLAIHDDGVGGADPSRGSGLTGLRDRVEALGGHLAITSPLNVGTSLLVTIPTPTDAQTAELPHVPAQR
ncbi:hypothetical protein GCM10010399_13430 [Dactylosporangium fulvum]|uniref:histidine kinase n=1 Tax=Dactylosporangium fulvum TaxID=53359 RepID=A0ABY5W7F4_9ACTN|nr:DUF4118 domain-containing protein [Dactylosporangium fulvum]UWP85236.1 DUF4118 domain-containing protein [Dactylosporangium fulvum]